MKPISFKITVILLLFSLMGAGCEEDDEEPQLPPISQTGAGTFGCIVDGRIWLPHTNYYYPKWHVVVGKDDMTKQIYLSIIAYQGGAGHLGLFICEKELDVGSRIILKRIDEEECIDAVFMSGDNLIYQIDNHNTGELMITRLDLNEKVVSGTFWFDAIDNLNKKVEIRDGRFDLIIDQIMP